MDYQGLVKKLIERGYLKTPLVIDAFKNINRADFVPDELKDEAGDDSPLPIGWGQTISQPLTVALMLELLQPRPGEKILDVGSGSGWTSALLGQCVGEKGQVFAVERIPELCEFGKNNIFKYNFINKGIIKLICADASRGLAVEAPFDKILVSAAAPDVSAELKNQLKVGGRLLMPVKNSIWLAERKNEKEFNEKEFYGFSFVPLIKNH